MIYGIGVDSAQVARLQQSMQKEGFCQWVFSMEEQAYFDTKGENGRHESAAASFAAKEAFLKAVGTGLGGLKLAEISVQRRESGAPYYVFLGEAAEFCQKNRLRAHLSLTHEAGIATAFTVVEQDPPKHMNLPDNRRKVL